MPNSHEVPFDRVGSDSTVQTQPFGVWQSIETAPKDGTSVLLSDGSYVSQGGWVTDVDHGADYEGQLGIAGWWHIDGDGSAPTHWMPMPPAPSAMPTIEAVKRSLEAA